jgi:hypothetical protein
VHNICIINDIIAREKVHHDIRELFIIQTIHNNKKRHLPPPQLAAPPPPSGPAAPTALAGVAAVVPDPLCPAPAGAARAPPFLPVNFPEVQVVRVPGAAGMAKHW